MIFGDLPCLTVFDRVWPWLPAFDPVWPCLPTVVVGLAVLPTVVVGLAVFPTVVVQWVVTRRCTMVGYQHDDVAAPPHYPGTTTPCTTPPHCAIRCQHVFGWFCAVRQAPFSTNTSSGCDAHFLKHRKTLKFIKNTKIIGFSRF